MVPVSNQFEITGITGRLDEIRGGEPHTQIKDCVTKRERYAAWLVQ